LKAVVLDDSDDTTNADREAGLAEFLRNDVRRCVRIEETLTDDLANDLVGADIVALGARLVGVESRASMFAVELEQLIIPLSAQTELLRGLCGAKPFALAFQEHGEAGDEEVTRKNGELAGGADDAVPRDVELHGSVLRYKAWAEKRVCELAHQRG
jgi:hypothetical protein